jgi:hypothetical protein
VPTSRLGTRQLDQRDDDAQDPRSSRDLHAARVVYRSTNGDGADTKVSGTVFTPEASPSPGGWPIALAHGTTGIEEQCARSGSADLWGLSEPVRTYVKMGYAVALADYQGLGEDGVHPYMDAKTAGLNVIDSVRALRHTFPGTSRHWLAFGGSQGGSASWAVDELANVERPRSTVAISGRVPQRLPAPAHATPTRAPPETRRKRGCCR